MDIKTNADLIQAVNAAIAESGYKKTWIAEQLGISNQNLSRYLSKKNFSLDDANKILNLIGYEIQSKIIKKNKQKTIDKYQNL